MMAMHLVLRETCPYCLQSFKISLDTEIKDEGLSNFLIKPHEACPEFLIFVDANGRIRGTQVIDSKFTNIDKKELNSYIKLFEDETNSSLFYHIQKIENETIIKPHSGVISARNVKHHQFLRSDFYKAWLHHFKEKKQDFAFCFIEDMIVGTINLYDMIRFTIGYSITDFLEDNNLESIPQNFDLIKTKIVAIGEKLLSFDI